MSKLLVVVTAAVLTSSALHANPLRDPKRLVNGQTVDLNSLFQWWTNHTGSRPLTAWVRVTGRVVGTNGWGWVVEGRVEHTQSSHNPSRRSGHTVLWHPPLADRADFERLNAQLKELNRQRQDITSAESAAAKQSSAVTKEQNAYRKYGLRNGNLTRENRVLKMSEDQAKATLKPLDRQIQDLKKQLAAFPSPDHYEVDCFALDTGQTFEDMPLYDHGTALR